MTATRPAFTPPTGVPIPAAMDSAGPWARAGMQWERPVYGPHMPSPIPLQLVGVQSADSTVEDCSIELGAHSLAPEAARMLGAALFAAAYLADCAQRPTEDHTVTEVPDDDQTGYDRSDEAWGDPRWRVDSTTRRCCGAVGGHARGCGQGLIEALAQQVPGLLGAAR